MKIGLLSNTPKSYSARRLREAARKRGHTLRVLATSQFAVYVAEGNPELLLASKPLGKLDAVIPRIAASQSVFGTAVVRQFEQMGIFCLNASHAISVSRDKLRTMQILSRHHIGIPPTAFVFSRADIQPAIEKVGKAPVIIKVLEGTQGVGVILAESNKVAEAMIEALQVAGQNVLIQKFVSESKGRDIRAFVVGDRVVASMRRMAQGEEFRSNVHLGGQTEAINLDPTYEAVAIRAAQIMGLRVAGVDLLEGKDGPQVMEINSSPGLEGIETATKIDVAGSIIDYLAEQIMFPDVDIRERLLLRKGYSVVEVPVTPRSGLSKKSIEETRLSEQEIQVLSITRGSVILPSPRPTDMIMPGDVLLCFGKQLSLRGLIPPKGRKRTKHGADESSHADDRVVNSTSR